MSKTYAMCAVVGIVLGWTGRTIYRNHKENQKMAKVRANVASLIKDVPGYTKPSR